jgi:hypothetical protein
MKDTQVNQKTEKAAMLKKILQELENISDRIGTLEKFSSSQTHKSTEFASPEPVWQEYFIDLDRWFDEQQ